MADRTWKAFERRLAKTFGTTRIPAAGWGEGKQLDAPDFETDRFAIQAKKGYAPPTYLTSWLAGIVRVATGRSRLGVVVWAGKGIRDDDAFVVMRLADFRALAAEVEHREVPLCEMSEPPSSPSA